MLLAVAQVWQFKKNRQTAKLKSPSHIRQIIGGTNIWQNSAKHVLVD